MEKLYVEKNSSQKYLSLQILTALHNKVEIKGRGMKYHMFFFAFHLVCFGKLCYTTRSEQEQQCLQEQIHLLGKLT